MIDQVGILIAVTAGLLSFLSPCVLPLVPSYLSFVTGMTLDDIQEGTDRRAVLVHAGLFVSGFTAIFLLMGASASFLGQFFLIYEDWIARIGSREPPEFSWYCLITKSWFICVCPFKTG